MPAPDPVHAPGTAHALVRRRDAAQATLDRWSTRKHVLGTADCVRMTAAHLRLLGRRVKLPPAGSYRTIPGAVKALAAAGHASIGEALDALGLERIAPAAAIVGDVILLPAAHELGALSVCMGNGRVAGWHETHADGIVVMEPLTPIAAWRADPL